MKMPVAHSFILETLLDSRCADRLRVKSMFGSHAIYVDDKIVFILRHRKDKKTSGDNGLWVVAAFDQVESLLAEFKQLRRIKMFKKKSGSGIPT